MWKSIQPPTQGDYCASLERDPAFRRAWTRAGWSAPWHRDDPEHIQARARTTPAENPFDVEWLDAALVDEYTELESVVVASVPPRARRRAALASKAPQMPVHYALH
jgi:hypothetical protein